MMKRFKEYDKIVSEEGEGVASVVPANVSGPDVSTDIPVVKLKDIKKIPFSPAKTGGHHDQTGNC